jgi:hypothetical protein
VISASLSNVKIPSASDCSSTKRSKASRPAAVVGVVFTKSARASIEAVTSRSNSAVRYQSGPTARWGWPFG